VMMGGGWNGTFSALCPVMGFGVSSVDPLALLSHC
jgi:hypothetical protein